MHNDGYFLCCYEYVSQVLHDGMDVIKELTLLPRDLAGRPRQVVAITR